MRTKAVGALLLILAFSGCATSDRTYADRNNVDTARARCVELARTSGYDDIKTESINRDGQAEWKVELAVRKDGRSSKERCEYTTLALTGYI
jgi:hypothetical protein